MIFNIKLHEYVNEHENAERADLMTAWLVEHATSRHLTGITQALSEQCHWN